LNIGLNMAFIPIWGIMGAAIATLVAYVIGNCLAFYFGEKYYPIGFHYLRLSATVVVTCLGIALQLILLSTGYPIALQYGLIIFIWAVIALFFAFKVIGRDKIREVRTAARNYLRLRRGD